MPNPKIWVKSRLLFLLFFYFNVAQPCHIICYFSTLYQQILLGPLQNTVAEHLTPRNIIDTTDYPFKTRSRHTLGFDLVMFCLCFLVYLGVWRWREDLLFHILPFWTYSMRTNTQISAIPLFCHFICTKPLCGPLVHEEKHDVTVSHL